MDPRLALSTLVDPPGTDPDYVKACRQPPPVEMLSDGEWLEDECGEVLVRLKYQDVFKRDALLYRQTSDARQGFVASVKRAMKHVAGRRLGSFCRRVYGMANVDHPRNWLPCGPCGGTGRTARSPSAPTATAPRMPCVPSPSAEGEPRASTDVTLRVG